VRYKEEKEMLLYTLMTCLVLSFSTQTQGKLNAYF